MSPITRREIESLRAAKPVHDDRRPAGVSIESEATGQGGIASVLTTFLVGAECSFRCTMCDLWQFTLDAPTRKSSLVEQLNWAIDQCPATDWIKLYNASNFFDPRSVPVGDLQAIAACCAPYERVIVENHPRWIRDSICGFRDLLSGRLEIAMGLETVDPSAMQLLQKEFTLDEFRHAADWITQHDIDLRCFVLLQPPGVESERAVTVALDTIEFARQCGARHVSIIATRGGNGIVEKLQSQGLFNPPEVWQLEQTLAATLDRFSGIVVTADTWGWNDLVGHCDHCRSARRERIESINQSQTMLPTPSIGCQCRRCDG